MAKADYILCDRCDCKVVYDAEDTIKDGLQALGLGDVPILCKDCRATPPAGEGREALIDALTAERDKAIKERNAFRDTGKAFVAGLGDRLQCADDALAAAQERERALREALEPAIRYAVALLPLLSPEDLEDDTNIILGNDYDPDPVLTVGDMKRFAALQTKEDGNGR